MLSANMTLFMQRWKALQAMNIHTYKELEINHNAAILIQRVWRRCRKQ
jgi:hypothetical protein